MSQSTDISRELSEFESALKRLEAEYNMYFGGRLPRPPWESRARVAALAKRLDRQHIANYGERFRFATLQARFQALSDMWDRGLRAREEGRPGPFARRGEAPRTGQADAEPGTAPPSGEHVTTMRDPAREQGKLRELYEQLTQARRAAGEEPVPFHKFATLVREQVTRLRESGSSEVAFRVAVRDGKVDFTAKGLKGVGEESA